MESEKLSFKNINIKALYAMMFFFTGLVVLAFSFILGNNYESILRNTVVSFILAGCVIFMHADACGRGEEGFSYDNFNKKNRFIITYLLMVVLSCVLSLVPSEFWPYMSLIVILALFSNNEIGLISGLGFITISVMLEQNSSYGELFMYLISAAVALALLRGLNENTNIGYPIFIALLTQAVLLIAFYVLFLNRTLSFSVLIVPILNIMLNLIILLIFLNMFGVYVIRKSNDMYMEINDAEYPLLTALKEKNKDEYFRAIHIGYLSERIALGLGLNDRAVKTCAYYHRIGVLDGKLKWEDVEHYYTENNFPPEATKLLHEYIAPVKGQVKTKESLAVNLSETVIASIMYLIKKNKDVKIDYDKLIDGIFDNKEKDGFLKEYEITFSEYDEMRKILKKEKLYYDFLR